MQALKALGLDIVGLSDFHADQLAAADSRGGSDLRHGVPHRTGSPTDLLRVLEAENGYWFHAHPRTKGSTGYPDAEIDTPWIGSDHYLGVAFKPGMGVDLSAERLCDYRCFGSIDTLNNHSTRCAPGTSSSPPARFSLSGTMTG